MAFLTTVIKTTFASGKRSSQTVAIAIASIASSLVASPVLADGDLSARHARWEQRLRARVNSLLVYPLGSENRAGDVFVGFRVGENGKPANVVIRKTAGQPIFDRAAIRLVSSLGRIGPMPSSDGRPHEVILKLSYGEPYPTVREAMHLAKADREEQLLNERRNRAIVANGTKFATQ